MNTEERHKRLLELAEEGVFNLESYYNDFHSHVVRFDIFKIPNEKLCIILSHPDVSIKFAIMSLGRLVCVKETKFEAISASFTIYDVIREPITFEKFMELIPLKYKKRLLFELDIFS